MRRGLAILTAWLLLPVAGSAHRLDEYLQASRLGIERDRVNVEIDLTPGVAVAPEVFAWIDTNRNGGISPAEADAYARRVLDSITLDVDGRRQSLALLDRQVPSFVDMSQGVGTIRLRASAGVPLASAGSHRLVYRNLHQPDVSVYLVNALRPDGHALAITSQHRDIQQHELRVDYQVESAWGPPATHAWRVIAALSAASVLAALTWRRRRLHDAESHLT